VEVEKTQESLPAEDQEPVAKPAEEALTTEVESVAQAAAAEEPSAIVEPPVSEPAHAEADKHAPEVQPAATEPETAGEPAAAEVTAEVE
jgi:hypothetical protein